MTIASYEEDIFSDSAILDPYPHYQRMREIGPVVFLPQHDLFALPRYANVKKALLDHRRFSSAEGIAGFKWPKEIDVANTIASDEPVHSRFRKVIGEPLAPPALQPLTAQIEQAADDLIVRLIAKGVFDGVADLARYLPVTIVSTLVGLPEEGRERMLEWAAASFEVLGVANNRCRAAYAQAAEMINYVQTKCSPETVKPTGWAAQIWRAAAEGRITAQEAGILHIDILAPALDTTISATSHLFHQLAKNPDQWEVLKQDPALIPVAIEEAVRLESPIRAFARVTTEDVDVEGATVPAGARVLVMYASANRDERHWQDPERFWIQRPNVGGQLGFGQGRHTCAGMHLAKLEMRSLLKAVVARVDRIEIHSQPAYKPNNVLRLLESMPMEFRTAA